MPHLARVPLPQPGCLCPAASVRHPALAKRPGTAPTQTARQALRLAVAQRMRQVLLLSMALARLLALAPPLLTATRWRQQTGQLAAVVQQVPQGKRQRLAQDLRLALVQRLALHRQRPLLMVRQQVLAVRAALVHPRPMVSERHQDLAQHPA